MDSNKEAGRYETTWTKRNISKALTASIISLFLFLLPVPYQGQWTIGIGIAAESLQLVFQDGLVAFMTLLLVLSGIMTLLAIAAEKQNAGWLQRFPFYARVICSQLGMGRLQTSRSSFCRHGSVSDRSGSHMV